jgi:hypothetical protein
MNMSAVNAWLAGVGVGLCLLQSEPASAQAPVSVPLGGQLVPVSRADVELLNPEIERALQRQQVFPLVADPAISEVAAAALNQVALEVSKEGEAIGKARLAWPIGRSAIDLVLKGPITPDGGEPLTGAGLSNGASIRVGFLHTVWAQKRAVSEIEALARAQNLSLTEAASAFVSAVQRNGEVIRNSGALTGQRVSPSVARLAGVLPANVSTRRAMRALVEQDLLWVESAIIAAAAYETNSQSFSYLDPIALSNTSVRRRGEAVSFSVGYGRTGMFEGVTAKQPLGYIGMSFTGGEGFFGSPEQQICRPLDVNPAVTQCETVALAGPIDSSIRVLKIEGRQWLRDQSVGLNPQLIRDFTADESFVELNVSALVFKKGEDGTATYELDTSALTAGARIGWGFKGPREGAYFALFFSTVLGMW